MRKRTILFFTTNPSGTTALALREEADAIQRELKRARRRRAFKVVTRSNGEPLDVLREIRKLRPTIVQFSGHGGFRAALPNPTPVRDIAVAAGAPEEVPSHGLFFQNADGALRFVSATALRSAFREVGSSVKLVILNACNSAATAEALLAHVDCAVGMSGAIRDDAATTYSIGLYNALGEAESVASAHRAGCAAIGLQGHSDGDLPQLKVRSGIDAGAIVLAERPAPPSVLAAQAMVSKTAEIAVEFLLFTIWPFRIMGRFYRWLWEVLPRPISIALLLFMIYITVGIVQCGVELHRLLR